MLFPILYTIAKTEDEDVARRVNLHARDAPMAFPENAANNFLKVNYPSNGHKVVPVSIRGTIEYLVLEPAIRHVEPAIRAVIAIKRKLYK